MRIKAIGFIIIVLIGSLYLMQHAKLSDDCEIELGITSLTAQTNPEGLPEAVAYSMLSNEKLKLSIAKISYLQKNIALDANPAVELLIHNLNALKKPYKKITHAQYSQAIQNVLNAPKESPVHVYTIQAPFNKYSSNILKLLDLIRKRKQDYNQIYDFYTQGEGIASFIDEFTGDIQRLSDEYITVMNQIINLRKKHIHQEAQPVIIKKTPSSASPEKTDRKKTSQNKGE